MQDILAGRPIADFGSQGHRRLQASWRVGGSGKKWQNWSCPAAGQSDIADGQLVDHGAVIYAGRQLADERPTATGVAPSGRQMPTFGYRCTKPLTRRPGANRFPRRGASQMAVQIPAPWAGAGQIVSAKGSAGGGPATIRWLADWRHDHPAPWRASRQGSNCQRTDGCQGVFSCIWICMSSGRRRVGSSQANAEGRGTAMQGHSENTSHVKCLHGHGYIHDPQAPEQSNTPSIWPIGACPPRPHLAQYFHSTKWRANMPTEHGSMIYQFKPDVAVIQRKPIAWLRIST